MGPFLVLAKLDPAAVSALVLAQGAGDAQVVADGLVKNPLAWMVLGLGATCFWLAKALMASQEKRIEEHKAHQAEKDAMNARHIEQILGTHTGVVTLSLKHQEGLAVLDKAIDRFTQRQE